MPEPKRRLKVFLCHAHSDATAVRDLFRYLRREGVDVWLDKENLLPGVDWDLEIRKAVRESDVVVVCLSKKSVTKEGYVQKEIKFALDVAGEKPEGEIFVIPARLEECEVPDSLNKWHWVDLFEERGRQKLIYALRARGDRVGASLRRRSGARSSKSVSERNEDEDVHLPVTAWPSPPNPQESENAIGLPPRPEDLRTLDKQENLRSYLSKARSGIWIDDFGNVMRGSKKLGTLIGEPEHSLLVYLIEHKGEVCSYSSLAHIIEYGRSNFRWYSNYHHFGTSLEFWVRNAIRDIWQIIEEDPIRPIYLIDTGSGYKLDW